MRLNVFFVTLDTFSHTFVVTVKPYMSSVIFIIIRVHSSHFLLYLDVCLQLTGICTKNTSETVLKLWGAECKNTHVQLFI